MPLLVDSAERIAAALERIASSLEWIVDGERRCLRMVDIDRAEVYSRHLGKKLRVGSRSRVTKPKRHPERIGR